MTVLLTGGAGYIGSHTAVELIAAGYDVLIADNFANSHPEAVRRIGQITGVTPPSYNIDITDKAKLEIVFSENQIDAVIHFAGFKAVGESVSQPLKYYHNNLTSTITLHTCMEKYDVRKLVFSSSATVYGIPKSLPLTEDMPVSATNPYGQTKLMIEQILRDIHQANPNWSISLLRYFNPVGAHESGLIGESPSDTPNNLMPYISQVAIGVCEKLKIFGNDYPTKDGTGMRDYIHVVDLARGHVAALRYLDCEPVFSVFNLGSGKAYSVLEMVNAFQSICGKPIPYVFVPRRAGDVAECYANPDKALLHLGWKTEKTLEDICRDTWNWQRKNPNGYGAHAIP